MRWSRRMARWLEVLSGVLASLVGLATLAYLLFVPVYRGTGCITPPGQPPECTATYATLLNATDPGTQVEVALVALLLAGVAVSTLGHVRTGRASARIALVGLTGVLFLWTICIWLLPGVLLPSVALATVACLAAALDTPNAPTTSTTPT